ncbi:thiol reductant ABC exporter subunit CydD [Xylanimonas allomyrinae]|uniref:Thiol reductant ABC exporter subunit CydD n=1 Tax=Xylanimonas allomyrinae TaxID=2509459 RepID=A0A4P6EI59_9MICO|nr:thiol reductant ABC exporter subunit CydD [Xylanimonas allomyrinae]QAY62114.1 thiol reductant ABC exporter subunit CydD [Xylanimonas allomyrinae]
MKPLDPRLLQRARSARRYVVLTAGLGLGSAILVVAQALLIASLLAGLVTHGSVPGQTAVRTLGALVGVAAGRAVVAWAQERYAQRAAASTVAELRSQVVAHAVTLGPRWADGGRQAEAATLATRGLDALEPYLVKYLPSLLLTALVTPAVLLVMLGLDWVSLVICVVTLPLVPLFMWLVGVMTQGTSERRLAVVERLGAQVLDLLAGLPTLRAFGRETGPGARVRALGDASKRATMSTLRVAFLSGMVLELLTTLSVAIVAVGVGLRLVEGAMSLETGLAVIMLAPEVYLPLRAVGAQFHASTDGIAAAERAFAVLETPVPERATHSPSGRVSAIVLDGVTVRAGDRAVEAPSALSARIPLGTGVPGDGRVVALRGPSGAGKSTAVQVLLGLLLPDAGSVHLELSDDGARAGSGGSVAAGAPTLVDLRDVDHDWWWSHVAWVPQRPAIAPGRLRDVVGGAGARADAAPSDAEVLDAARTTGLDAVVAALPAGWDTPVGLGGVGLSVGQRQRVALTAAMLAGADRPVVVLDEPTAHLDAAGERVVLDTVRAWRDAGRTVVVVAHRASLLALADQVVDVAARAPEGATA